MNKGQADTVSVAIIIGISISLLSAAYFWGMPLIHKYQDTSKYKQIYESFSPENPDSLPNKILFLVRNGGRIEYTLPSQVGIRIHDESDSIEFVFTSKVSGIASDIGWVSLLGGVSCDATEGLLGIDKPYLLCAKSERVGDVYQITFNITSRELEDSRSGVVYKIDFYSSSVSSASTNKLLLIYEGMTSPSPNSIIHKIKIELEWWVNL